jgi:hypothetical protein
MAQLNRSGLGTFIGIFIAIFVGIERAEENLHLRRSLINPPVPTKTAPIPTGTTCLCGFDFVAFVLSGENV